jgi:hypothetical protein
MVKDPRNELLNALKAMREDLRKVTDGVLLCKEGEIEALSEYLLKMPATKIKDFASPWLRKTRDLKLKPAKGRIKDLKKIDGLLGNLLDSVIEADDLEVKPKSPRKKRGALAKSEADKKEIPSA